MPDFVFTCCPLETMKSQQLDDFIERISRGEVDEQELLSVGEDSADWKTYTNESGFSCLITAATNAHWALLKTMLELGCPPDPIVPLKHSAIRGAAIRGHLDCVQLLLDYQADPNVLSLGARTAIMGAAMNGHTQVVALLLEHGADPDRVNDFGETALDLAGRNGHTEIMSLLKNAASKQSTSPKGKNE